MPVPATIDDFLALARKSNQLDNSRLDAYLAAERPTPLPAEPRKFAQQLIRDGVITVFQAEQFLQGKYKGFLLGGYRIVERIGQGGSGTVYYAEHAVMKRPVAVKVLPTPLAEDPEMLERFRLEARTAAALDHPNIVHVYDFRQEGALHFIVMEFIDGPDLQQVLGRHGALSIPLACEYARQAALGLQHAHEEGMVHRDIKPANLLVDATGTIKVLDMGLARYEQPGTDSLTERFNTKMVLGTADYLAPEQALNLHNTDARTDLYSLGATLYALLAGRPPFHDASIGQKLMFHQMKEPEPVTKYRPEVPAGLAALVARMLAKKPADRPESAAEVAEALAVWARQEPRPEVPTGLSGVALLKTGRTALPASARSGRVMEPRGVAPDTRSHQKDDTGSIELEEKSRRRPSMVAPLPDLTLQENGAWLRLGVLVGVVALVAGLAGGVVAFLLWGPRVG
ncbi:MAG: serine/threonine-protein kinase [Gemmataceae bacterium]